MMVLSVPGVAPLGSFARCRAATSSCFAEACRDGAWVVFATYLFAVFMFVGNGLLIAAGVACYDLDDGRGLTDGAGGEANSTAALSPLALDEPVTQGESLGTWMVVSGGIGFLLWLTAMSGASEFVQGRSCMLYTFLLVWLGKAAWNVFGAALVLRHLNDASYRLGVDESACPVDALSLVGGLSIAWVAYTILFLIFLRKFIFVPVPDPDAEPFSCRCFCAWCFCPAVDCVYVEEKRYLKGCCVCVCCSRKAPPSAPIAMRHTGLQAAETTPDFPDLPRHVGVRVR